MPSRVKRSLLQPQFDTPCSVELRHSHLTSYEQSSFHWVPLMGALSVPFRTWHKTIDHLYINDFASEQERVVNPTFTTTNCGKEIAQFLQL
jgi:hypothetical protein